MDRLPLRVPAGPRFAPREPPDCDVTTYLHRQLSSRGHSCLLHVGADWPWGLTWMITSVDVAFTLVDGPPELVTALRDQAARCLSALKS